MLRAAHRLKSIAAHLAPSTSESSSPRLAATMTTFNRAALDKGPKELQNKGLVLLTAQTPNGNKPAYLLEELKAVGAISGYSFIPTSFKDNEQVCTRLRIRRALVKADFGALHVQKSEWFEAVNPNGRIPALLDNREGKEPLRVFESAAILMYLAKAYDTDFRFHFKDDDLETEMISWIFFMSVSVERSLPHSEGAD